MSRGGGSRRSMIALNGKGNMTRDTSKRAVWMDTVQTPIDFIYFTHQPMGPVPVKQTPLSFPSRPPTSPHTHVHSRTPMPRCQSPSFSSITFHCDVTITRIFKTASLTPKARSSCCAEITATDVALILSIPRSHVFEDPYL